MRITIVEQALRSDLVVALHSHIQHTNCISNDVLILPEAAILSLFN